MSATANPLMELTAFQRDLLKAVGECGESSGQDVKTYLEDAYGKKVNHGQLYPNLDSLVEMGLVEKGQIDRRTNSYGLSERGEARVNEHGNWWA